MIPIDLGRSADKLLWHFDKKGTYEVKSGYRIAMNEKIVEACSDPSVNQNWWSRLWSLNVPPKVKIFIWRLCNNALPSLSNLCWRKVVREVSCPRCGLAVEIVGHAVWWCSNPTEVWASTSFWGTIASFHGLSCDEVLRGLAVCLKIEAPESVCMILWGIWQARNNVVHKRKDHPVVGLVEGV
ncbi:hypothetical protein Ddye_014069 [Dipteronia dyeriana]|uniref:Reverse transcriptase zinc-binding domain-containing protein n=1 Tax=Dipteronia dyeriana TaxID=168575 RepID=A0AAD9X7J9_9ROSI|nr:hypothetical protein Ddye_014069 [Dipteronia dyeriana]